MELTVTSSWAAPARSACTACPLQFHAQMTPTALRLSLEEPDQDRSSCLWQTSAIILSYRAGLELYRYFPSLCLSSCRQTFGQRALTLGYRTFQMKFSYKDFLQHTKIELFGVYLAYSLHSSRALFKPYVPTRVWGGGRILKGIPTLCDGNGFFSSGAQLRNKCAKMEKKVVQVKCPQEKYVKSLKCRVNCEDGDPLVVWNSCQTGFCF